MKGTGKVCFVCFPSPHFKGKRHACIEVFNVGTKFSLGIVVGIYDLGWC